MSRFSFASELRVPGDPDWAEITGELLDIGLRDQERALALFGDGSDGDLIVGDNSPIILTRDMNYRNVIVPEGKVLQLCGGFALRVSGYLDLSPENEDEENDY